MNSTRTIKGRAVTEAQPLLHVDGVSLVPELTQIWLDFDRTRPRVYVHPTDALSAQAELAQNGRADVRAIGSYHVPRRAGAKR